MRTLFLVTPAVLGAALTLSACNETAGPAATPDSPAAVATTNAKVEPVPTETAKPEGPVLPTPPAGADDSAGDTCGALEAAQFVGRQDRPTTRTDLEKAVGHDRIRWIGPDDVVTMDYSAERLNVILDETRRLIKGARCG